MILHGLFFLGKNGCAVVATSRSRDHARVPRLSCSGRAPRRRNIVLEKHWRDGVHRQLTELFFANVEAAANPDDVAPLFATPRHVLVHVKRGELFIIGAVGREVAPLLVIELLSRIADLLEMYLKELTEDALRDNFITVYQLLDEMIDNGAPLHIEPNVLQELVLPPAEMKSMVAAVTGSSQVGAACCPLTRSTYCAPSAPHHSTAPPCANNSLPLRPPRHRAMNPLCAPRGTTIWPRPSANRAP